MSVALIHRAWHWFLRALCSRRLSPGGEMDASNRKVVQDFVRLKQSARKMRLHLQVFLEVLLADNAALEAKIDEAAAAVAADEAADVAALAARDATITALNAVIDDLRVQLAAATPIDTQPLINKLEAIVSGLVSPA